MDCTILHLWPDALARNGSQGNLLCLQRRLEWRGIAAHIREIRTGDPFDIDGADLLYLGAGLLEDNEALWRALADAAPALREYAGRGGAILAVCEGFELLGREIAFADGRTFPGAGAADFTTVYEADRLTGDLLFTYQGATAAAFENHAGRIVLGEGAEPLGRLISGYGNNGRDGTVGLRWKNIFACSAFGPLLPKNPALADDVLRAALRARYPDAQLSPLDDELEKCACGVIAARQTKDRR